MATIAKAVYVKVQVCALRLGGDDPLPTPAQVLAECTAAWVTQGVPRLSVLLDPLVSDGLMSTEYTLAATVTGRQAAASDWLRLVCASLDAALSASQARAHGPYLTLVGLTEVDVPDAASGGPAAGR